MGKNSTSLKRVRQQDFISSCWSETVYSQRSIYVSWLPSAFISHFKMSPRPFKLPPPHSSNCLGDSLRLEIKRRTLFATVVMVRLGVWNTNCWDLLCKSYLLPLTVCQTVKANQPLRWDVDTNSEKRGWTFCPASSTIKIRYCWLDLMTVELQLSLTACSLEIEKGQSSICIRAKRTRFAYFQPPKSHSAITIVFPANSLTSPVGQNPTLDQKWLDWGLLST